MIHFSEVFLFVHWWVQENHIDLAESWSTRQFDSTATYKKIFQKQKQIQTTEKSTVSVPSTNTLQKIVGYHEKKNNSPKL